MKKRVLSIVLKYGITLLFGAALAWSVLGLHGYGEAATDAERYRALSDAFTIPGMLLLMLGLLVALSHAGSFIGLGYVMTHMLGGLIPGMRTHKEERFYDYYQRKKKKEKAGGYGFLIISGLILLGVAVVFLVLFYQVFTPGTLIPPPR